MTEPKIYKLKINDNFKRLIPPLSSAELHQLEQNIIRDGCREPLIAWNYTIIDGHNRYNICTQLQIPFAIQHIYFESYEEVTAWICANQLGRRNITDETRKYLIGKRYEMEKIIGAHNAFGINQHTKKEVRSKILTEATYDKTAYRTRERLGEEYHLSHYSVDRYGSYSQALDTLSTIAPEFVPKILSGQIKISHENIVELSLLSTQEICHLITHISEDPASYARYSDTRKFLPKKMEQPQKLVLPTPTTSVKDMPAYDPDAEVTSLSLTIPSWISSIDRTRSITNTSYISKNARCKIENELLRLREAIDTMLAAVKEVI